MPNAVEFSRILELLEHISLIATFFFCTNGELVAQAWLHVFLAYQENNTVVFGFGFGGHHRTCSWVGITTDFLL